MKCSDFEKRLSAFLKGELTAEKREAALAHLEDCSACRQTAQIARGDLDLQPEGSPGNFVRAVLELTSGDTCQHSRRHLCDFVDGALCPEYSEVVAGHLQTCRRCSELFLALTELAQVLPEMASVEPDPLFSNDVLAVTSRSSTELHPLPHPILRFVQTIFQRPRFSLEAAYAGTLLILMIWNGFAASSVEERSSQRWASVQISLSTLANALQARSPEEWFRDRSERVSHKITGEYFVWKQKLGHATFYMRQQFEELSLKSGRHLKARAEAALTVVAGHFHELWEALPVKSSIGEELATD